MIQLKGISKKYNNKEYALKNVNIKFNKTGLIFILGNENSGKSTFLSVMGGLDTPSEGEIIINGKSMANFTKKELDYYRNTYVSFIFKDHNLLEKETVAKNINLALDLQEKKLGKGELRRILNVVGLNNVSTSTLVKDLTPGQKQIVCIARAIVKNPYVVLVDEPVFNVDVVTSRQIYDLLQKLSKNKLVIVFTRDQELAEKYSDRIFYIKNGVVVDDSKVEIIAPVVENFGLIKSTMPLVDTIKYSICNLFRKKIKFIFTLFFYVLFLICCGILISKNNFNLDNEHVKAMQKNNENEIKIIKYDNNYDKIEQLNSILSLNYLNYSKKTFNRTYFNNREISQINTNDKWIKEYKIIQNLKSPCFEFTNTINNDILYYTPTMDINFVTEDFNYEIIGRKPVANDEAVISKYVADQIIKNGILLKDSYMVYHPQSYEQIVNEQKDIVISNLGSIKIVGIKNDKLDDYEVLKTILHEDVINKNINLYNRLQYDINNKYNRVYVLNSYFEYLNLSENNLFYKTSRIKGRDKTNLVYNFGYILNNEYINTKDGIIGINDVNENEIVLSYDLLDEVTDGAYKLRLDEFIKNNPNYNDDEINKFIKNFLEERDLVVYTNVSNKISGNPTKKYKVMGVLLNKNIKKTTYYNKSDIIESIPKSIEINSLYTKSFNVKETLKSIPIEGFNIVSMTKYSKGIIEMSTLSYLFNVFVKNGIVLLGIISIILFIIFINASIKSRYYDINIYRSLGCRSKDVSKMFILESIIFSIISILLSNYFIKTLFKYFNDIANDSLNNHVLYYDFSIIKFIILSIIAIVIPLIITLIIISKLNNTMIIDLNKKKKRRSNI